MWLSVEGRWEWLVVDFATGSGRVSLNGVSECRVELHGRARGHVDVDVDIHGHGLEALEGGGGAGGFVVNVIVSVGVGAGRRAGEHRHVVVTGDPEEAAEARHGVCLGRSHEEAVLLLIVALEAVQEGEEDAVGSMGRDVVEMHTRKLASVEGADGLVGVGARLEDGEGVKEVGGVGETVNVSGMVQRRRGRGDGLWDRDSGGGHGEGRGG